MTLSEVTARSDRTAALSWLAAALTLLALAVAVCLAAPVFGYSLDVFDMPIAALTAAYCAVGLVFVLAIPRLILRSPVPSQHSAPAVLIIIFAAGLAARLFLMASEPILEVDYYRYLWDGTVTAHGITPYGIPPKSIIKGEATPEVLALANGAGSVLKRINHKDVTTIYPPVTQAAFALAHILKPWSLNAWRCVLLVFDFATFALLVAALDRLKTSRLWVALYWWNPVLLKESFNSAHFEPLIFPFLLGALLLANSRKSVAASAALGLAAGVKFWPALLLPLVLRASRATPKTAAAALVVFAAMMALWIGPIWAAGTGIESGVTAYTTGWRRNGPLFTAVDAVYQAANGLFGFDTAARVSLAARVTVAGLAALVALAMAAKPVADFRDLASRALLAVTAIVVLSPAVYPWYTLWILPLLVLRPVPGLMLLTATIPLYYLFFHYAAREATHVFHGVVTWLIWLPPMAVALWSWYRGHGVGWAPAPEPVREP